MQPTCSVIILTYKPDERFARIIRWLNMQTHRPEEILVINTQKRYFDPAVVSGYANVRVVHIDKQEFDHAGTRSMAAGMCQNDILVYMTMDAVPADRYLIANLLSAFEAPQTAAAYARQLPRRDADVLERYNRHFNYPPVSRRKTKADLPELGIKTYFCSDVCAAYRREVWEQMGGFGGHEIFNEDMIMAARMIKAGWAVQYCAQARVIHSHNYGALMQLRRNFDLGASQAMHPEIFEGISSAKEGKRMVASQIRHLWETGQGLQILRLIWISGFRYIGYRLGKSYRSLPAPFVRMLSWNREYWKKE